MTTDPLAALAENPEVRLSSDAARKAVDELLWNRSARKLGSELSAESTLAGAWCNAAFEGAEVLIAGLRQGTVEDSPMGRVAAQTLAMYAEIPTLADVLVSSPMQALARLQSIASDSEGRSLGSAGRPRSSDMVVDPLRVGTESPAVEIGPRLTQLGRLLTTDSTAPAIVLAGIAHAEVATMQPFESASGTVARSLTRAILRAKGVDPDGWTIPETGLRILGRPSYVKALRGYAQGTPDGVTAWLKHHAQIVQIGAQEASTWVDENQA